MSKPTTVFIVRDIDERYIKGVYATYDDAEAWIREELSDLYGSANRSDEVIGNAPDLYEILEMPLDVIPIVPL